MMKLMKLLRTSSQIREAALTLHEDSEQTFLRSLCELVKPSRLSSVQARLRRRRPPRENLCEYSQMKLSRRDTTMILRSSTATSSQIRKAALTWHEHSEQTFLRSLRELVKPSRLSPVQARLRRRRPPRENLCEFR